MSCSIQRDPSVAKGCGAGGQRYSASQPLILLADSRLLFPTTGGQQLLVRLHRHLPQGAKAVYLGASNGDVAEFFELFQAAMADIGVTSCQHCKVPPTPEGEAALAAADLVFLAGGDPVRGWRSFVEYGLDRKVVDRFRQGALLIGLSAGAMQLGLSARSIEEKDVDTFGLLNYLIDVHQEPTWQQLELRVQNTSSPQIGIGIPAGGGLLAHEDGSLEALAKTALLVQRESGKLERTDLLPDVVHSR